MLHDADQHHPQQPIEYNFTCTDPAGLLDHLCELRRLRTDAELAGLLGVAAPTLSKIRRGRTPVSAAIVLRIHEVFGLPTRTLREMLAAGRRQGAVSPSAQARQAQDSWRGTTSTASGQ